MGAAGNVDLVFTASDGAAMAAWQSQQRMADALIRKMEKLERVSKKSAGGMPAGRFLGDSARQMAGFALGGLGVTAILAKMTESGRNFAEQGLEAQKAWDKVFREFQGQSGLRGKAAALAEANIRKVAQETGIPVEEVGAAATQMVSSGFTAEEATGGALREQLRGMLATNVVGKEEIKISDIIRASSAYLNSQGLEKNTANVRDINSRISALYKSTEMQFGDFMEFSRESVGMKGILDIGTQMASFSSLVDSMPAPEAATGLRNVVGRMRTVRGTPEKTEGLAMLGIKPEEIDLVGEDFVTALKRINEGVKRTKPEDIPIALKKIFEEKGINTAQLLLNSIEKIEQRVTDQLGASEQFLKDANFAQQGLNAALRRQESERKGFMAKSTGGSDELMFSEARQYMLEKGFSAARADINLGIAKNLSYITGLSADTTLGPVLDADPKALSIVQQRVQAKLQGTNISPQKIEENMRRKGEKFQPKPFDLLRPNEFQTGGRLEFSPEQMQAWEAARKRYRNPNATFRNTVMNPWYDRPGRFPTEDKAIKQARGMEAEISGRLDAFGSLTPGEKNDFADKAEKMQRSANQLEKNVHAYDLQLTIDKLTSALKENTAATQANSKSAVPAQDATVSGPQLFPSYVPITAGQTRRGGS